MNFFLLVSRNLNHNNNPQLAWAFWKNLNQTKRNKLGGYEGILSMVALIFHFKVFLLNFYSNTSHLIPSSHSQDAHIGWWMKVCKFSSFLIHLWALCGMFPTCQDQMSKTCKNKSNTPKKSFHFSFCKWLKVTSLHMGSHVNSNNHLLVIPSLDHICITYDACIHLNVVMAMNPLSQIEGWPHLVLLAIRSCTFFLC